ncbi:MAG: hypothetical protein ACI81V_001207, partial [Lentimonas sp.]
SEMALSDREGELAFYQSAGASNDKYCSGAVRPKRQTPSTTCLDPLAVSSLLQ